ncbi:MAG TPA: hypothetical protein VIV11_18575 [Kofleriaceae bacterium]
MRWLACLLCAGCTVGISDDDSMQMQQTPDGGTTTSDGGSVTTPDAPGFKCRDKVTLVGDGHHNPGMNCQNGCHNHGFTLSGTLYTSAAGTTPVVGATITIKDADGFTYEMVSNQNGNFFTSSGMTFPVTVTASMCPDVAPMIGQITAGNGGCNKAGCHVAGAQGRVFLN